MTLSELLIKVPELENYLRYMPEELKTRVPSRPIHQRQSFIKKTPILITSASSAKVITGLSMNLKMEMYL